MHTYTKPQTSSTRSRGLGWRIHESVEDTKLSTNKQHTLSPIPIASAPRTQASDIAGRPHGWKNEAGRRATPERPRAPNSSRWNDQRPHSWPPRLGAASSPRRARSQSATTPPLFSSFSCACLELGRASGENPIGSKRQVLGGMCLCAPCQIGVALFFLRRRQRPDEAGCPALFL